MTTNIPSANLLAGKSTIVTGAGTGIGKAIAAVFAREGARVLALDFNEEAVKSSAAEIGSGVVPFYADVSREEDVAAAFAKAADLFGRIDGVVNNAGTIHSRNPEFSTDNYMDFSQTNFLGVLLCCKYAIEAMSENGGSIVNISSVSSLNTETRTPLVYAASKSAVNSLTKTIAVRHGAKGIRANVIAPGFTLSATNKNVPESIITEMGAKAALGRGADPEEQAQVAAFLVSDRASYVSGAIIPVDGAWSAKMI